MNELAENAELRKRVEPQHCFGQRTNFPGRSSQIHTKRFTVQRLHDLRQGTLTLLLSI